MSVFAVESGLDPSQTLRVKIDVLFLFSGCEMVMCTGIIIETIMAIRTNILPVFMKLI